MTLEQLQQKFGIANRLCFAEGPGRLIKAVLNHASGASAEIYLHGAHIASWRPARGADVIFMSRASRFQDGVAIRGGIPVIFPQFGDGPLPKHGLVRTRAWQVAHTALGADGAVVITLQLEDDEPMRALWPHPFSLQLAVTLGSALAVELAVKNTGASPFSFQAALHTYFQVADIAQISLSGLKGTAFDDFLCPGPFVETRAQMTFDRETDRLYGAAPDRVVLADQTNKRKIVITKNGMQSIVVWNPWIEKSKRLSDFGDDEYRRMVCVETGNMGAPSFLAAGDQWSGRTTFVCENA